MPELLRDQADHHPGDVDPRGPHHKAQRTQQGLGHVRHLYPVGMPVEDRKEPHEDHRSDRRELAVRRKCDSQGQHRLRNPQLCLKQRHTLHPKHSADQHQRDKCQRHRPDRLVPHLCTQSPHADHRQQVIKPQHRVAQARDEAAAVRRIMCKRDRGKAQRREDSNGKGVDGGVSDDF